jgi:hypothetical protein
MGDTRSGNAVSPTEKKLSDEMYLVCIGLIFALAVGSITVVADTNGQDDPIEAVFTSIDTGCVLDQGVDGPRTDFGTDIFVTESECGSWGPLDTEQGWIEVDRYNIPDELQLCIDDEYLSQWYVDVWVYGGYKPWERGGYIDVYQKNELAGRINIAWTWVEKGPCCAYDLWEARFYLDEPICLESNQYPDVAPWCIDWPDGQDTIPGKEVYMQIVTYWTGCTPGQEESQDFTII